jgi:hypothetical protein
MEKMLVTRVFLYITCKVPSLERCSLSGASCLFIYLHPSEPPVSSPPTKMGKTYGQLPRSPTRTEDLHTVGCGLVPQMDHLLHCCHYPSAMHDTFHLGLGRQEPI